MEKIRKEQQVPGTKIFLREVPVPGKTSLNSRSGEPCLVETRLPYSRPKSWEGSGLWMLSGSLVLSTILRHQELGEGKDAIIHMNCRPRAYILRFQAAVHPGVKTFPRRALASQSSMDQEWVLTLGRQAFPWKRYEYPCTSPKVETSRSCWYTYNLSPGRAAPWQVKKWTSDMCSKEQSLLLRNSVLLVLVDRSLSMSKECI